MSKIPTSVSSVWGTFNRFSIRTSDIGCFIPLFTSNHVKFNNLTIPYTAYCLFWIIFNYGWLTKTNVNINDLKCHIITIIEIFFRCFLPYIPPYMQSCEHTHELPPLFFFTFPIKQSDKILTTSVRFALWLELWCSYLYIPVWWLYHTNITKTIYGLLYKVQREKKIRYMKNTYSCFTKFTLICKVLLYI